MVLWKKYVYRLKLKICIINDNTLKLSTMRVELNILDDDLI